MKTDALAAAAAADRMVLLETFVRIVEAGSLSAAAAQLGSTQPTVSRRLQALERSLGVRLLQRSTHAMKLTEDGTRCYERAKELIASWQHFESEMRGASDEPTGLLRVVVPHAFGQQQLVGPLAGYLQRYPRMTVEWLLQDRTPDFIAEGIDCAIQVGEVRDPSVVALRLCEVPRIVVAAPALVEGAPPPSQPQELAQLPWLALRTYYRDEVVLTHSTTGERARFPIRPRLSTDSLYALRSAAMLGLGAGIASAWVLSEDLASGRLVHLAPQWQAAPLPVHLVYPPARFYPARLRRFIETMRDALPQAVGLAPVRSPKATSPEANSKRPPPRPGR
jgi:DNA-binding transcriptional LysR family regulator